MHSDDRSAEFSLNGDQQDDSKDVREQPEEFDWAQWATSGVEQSVPLLPFPPEEIFLPGEVKRLHLYEARFLALFEEVVVRFQKTFAHVLYASDRAALAAYGTVVAIKTWRRLGVGVYMEIEGIARFRISKLNRLAPFWLGECAHIEDLDIRSPDGIDELRDLERRVWALVREIISLCLRLGEQPIRKKVDTAAKTMGGEALSGTRDGPSLATENGLFMLSGDAKVQLFEQKLKQAAYRAANHERFQFENEDVDDATLLKRSRALSFAAWDFFPSSPADRQKALEGRDTLVRLRNVIDGLERYARNLAAKAAVQDAFSPPSDAG